MSPPDLLVDFTDDFNDGFSDLLDLPADIDLLEDLGENAQDVLVVTDANRAPTLPTNVQVFGTWITRTRLPGEHRDPAWPQIVGTRNV